MSSSPAEPVTADPDAPRDDAWFTALFHEHATSVHRYLLRRAHADDVEDLTAETFAVAWRRRDDIPYGFELQWLFRTAGFLVSNHHRKKRATPVEELPERDTTIDPMHDVIDDEGLKQAFRQLSDRDREVLLLSAWEGLGASDIAGVLNISSNAASVALSRARSRLLHALDGDVSDTSSPR